MRYKRTPEQIAAAKRRQAEKREIAHRIATWRWRYVVGLDDGVSLYQCLSCKEKWTSTAHHSCSRWKYCCHCGIKFVGQMSDNDNAANRSWERKRANWAPPVHPSFKLESISHEGKVLKTTNTPPCSEYCRIKSYLEFAKRDATVTDYSGPGWDGKDIPGTVRVSVNQPEKDL